MERRKEVASSHKVEPCPVHLVEALGPWRYDRGLETLTPLL